MPSTTKGKKLTQWTVAKKMEAVQARQRGLTIEEVRSLFGVCSHTLYKWIKAYDAGGLTALEQTGQRSGARSPGPKVQAAEQILESLTHAEPQAGLGKIQGALYRRGFLKLAKETIKKLLLRQGKIPAPAPQRRRNAPPKLKTFERAAPNDLWQTDIMTFMIKGQYRVYVIAFLDDNSRFIVGWGLHRFQTTVHVLEVFRAAIEKHGAPKEVLSDNGRQYYTWRGKSQFTVFLSKLGIRHIRSRPYHPQTMGKVESFWRNLLQESLQNTPLSSFEEAQAKIAQYVEYYNFKRPHQGIGNVTPSDRYFRVEGQVRQIVEQNTARVEDARSPMTEYRPPTYIVGNIGGRELRVVAKDAEVMLSDPPAGEMINSNSGQGAEIKEGSRDSALSSKNDPNPEASRLINETGVNNGELDKSQAAEPIGENGINTPGNGSPRADPIPLPAGGSIAGTVLAVDEETPQGGSGGPGSANPGTQTGLAITQSDLAYSRDPNPNPSLGAGPGPNAQGEGSLKTPLPGGPTDHQKESLGADPRSGG